MMATTKSAGWRKSILKKQLERHMGRDAEGWIPPCFCAQCNFAMKELQQIDSATTPTKEADRGD